MTLKELRLAKGLTQAEVANAVGISQAYLSDIEKNHRKGTKETREEIIKFLLSVPDRKEEVKE